MSIQRLQKEQLKETLEPLDLAIVDYYGKTCACCAATESELTSLDTTIPIYKVMVNSLEDVEVVENAVGSPIQSTPTCVIYRKGVEVHRFVGNHRKEEYELILNTL